MRLKGIGFLTSPTGLCSVGDDPDFLPFMHMAASIGDKKKVPPVRGEITDGRRRPDYDDDMSGMQDPRGLPVDSYGGPGTSHVSPQGNQMEGKNYAGATGQGDAGFGVPDTPIPTLE